jgi:hypothetical protein
VTLLAGCAAAHAAVRVLACRRLHAMLSMRDQAARRKGMSLTNGRLVCCRSAGLSQLGGRAAQGCSVRVLTDVPACSAGGLRREFLCMPLPRAHGNALCIPEPKSMCWPAIPGSV